MTPRSSPWRRTGIERGQCALDEFDGARAIRARERDAGVRRELEDLAVEIDGMSQRLDDGFDHACPRRRARGCR